MDISAGLIAKGTAGALAASAAVGGGVLVGNKDIFNGIFGANAEEGEKTLSVNGQVDNSLEEGRSTGGGNITEQPPGPTNPGIGQVQLSSTNGVDGDSHSKGAGNGLSRDDANSHTSGKPNSATQGSKKKAELTKFDQGLIDFLKNNGDFTFDVKKGDNDFTADDLTFSSTNTQPLTAKISILISKTEVKLIEGLNNKKEKGERLTLQKLNGNGNGDEGAPWTWTCEVTFTSEEADLTGKSIHDKDKIFKSTEEGLFGLLKKDVSTIEDSSIKKEAKDAKEKFIKVCARRREKNTDMEMGETLKENKLESTITINLKSGIQGGSGDQVDANVLYPKEGENKKIFERLFGEGTEESSPLT